MRSPLTYYGGKARMASMILARMPAHKTYVEPFAGGASIFWAKGPSQAEYINDKNGQLANFYRVMATQFEALYDRVQGTLHCEHTHREACEIYRAEPWRYDAVTRAWATWVACNMSFSGQIGGSFSWALNRQDAWSPPVATENRKAAFKQYAKRLEGVTIFSRDALDILGGKLNTQDTFWYLDPPYAGARQGHYGGYTQRSFEELIDRLEGVKGKFILSSYDNPALTDAVARAGWTQERHEMRLGVVSGPQRKVEVLTMNFEPNLNLFSNYE